MTGSIFEAVYSLAGPVCEVASMEASCFQTREPRLSPLHRYYEPFDSLLAIHHFLFGIGFRFTSGEALPSSVNSFLSIGHAERKKDAGLKTGVDNHNAYAR
ncbi:hypothetical protein [Brevibacillus borstelensis]|uniref:hypothetical protein n=1 Tax=Brevibacillus borstelensis TaxID=45462 RepID=UPI0030C61911